MYHASQYNRTPTALSIDDIVNEAADRFLLTIHKNDLLSEHLIDTELSFIIDDFKIDLAADLQAASDKAGCMAGR